MQRSLSESGKVPREKYWFYLERLILSADAGTTLATLGWILFWLDHIPDHVIHTHFVTGFVFLVSLAFGLAGTRILIVTGNRLGSRSNRVIHILKIAYTLTASATGIYAYFRFPPL